MKRDYSLAGQMVEKLAVYSVLRTVAKMVDWKAAWTVGPRVPMSAVQLVVEMAASLAEMMAYQWAEYLVA